MTTIILLIIFGIILILADIIFVPGAILGIFGLIVTLAGIIKSYADFGIPTGNKVLGITVCVFAIILFLCFKFNVWARFGLKNTISSRVNEDRNINLQPGQIGETVSALRPSGNAEFDEKIYEVQTIGDFCESGKKVKILKITNNKIFVEPIN